MVWRKCLTCNGQGTVPDPNPENRRGKKTCPACRGERGIDITTI